MSIFEQKCVFQCWLLVVVSSSHSNYVMDRSVFSSTSRQICMPFPRAGHTPAPYIKILKNRDNLPETCRIVRLLTKHTRISRLNTRAFFLTLPNILCYRRTRPPAWGRWSVSPASGYRRSDGDKSDGSVPPEPSGSQRHQDRTRRSANRTWRHREAFGKWAAAAEPWTELRWEWSKTTRRESRGNEC